MRKIAILFVCITLSILRLLAADNPIVISFKTEDTKTHIVAGKVPQFSFLFPEMAGTLRLGIISGNESRWPEQLKSNSFSTKNGNLAYEY